MTPRSVLHAAAAILLAAGFAHHAKADPVVSLHGSNAGIGAMTFSVVGTTITIDETWTSTGFGALQISGLDTGVDYTVVKNITNNTGESWISLANELLDPAGQDNDDLDPTPYPSFVPAGFTTSNDNDGLSFAQGSGIPRTSDVFPTLVVDEEADVRDFLDFSGGTLADGGAMVVSYGLRDNAGTNQPFLLAQRPNAESVVEVPEPASLALLGLGLAALGMARRRR